MLNAYNINIKTEGLKMLDYLDRLNHFEMMLVWLILLSVIFIIIYFIDKKNKVSNKDILKKRLAKG